MDYRRLTISELSRETKTSRDTISSWVRNGWLIPTQIVGARRKFTMDAFNKAEKLAKEAAIQKLMTDAGDAARRFESEPEAKKGGRRRKPNGLRMPGPGERIPPEIYDNIGFLSHTN